MNTPSHFLMTATVRKLLPKVAIATPAFLIGSVAPDIPLWLLSVGGFVYYQSILGKSSSQTFDLMFEHHYFHDPVWIVLHNFLHAPIILFVGLALVWRQRQQTNSWQRAMFWFLIACLFHSVVDILTHHDDGPLIFFPFSWSARFYSPVSYWDDRYYGREFGVFELSLNVVCLVYLLRPWRWLRRQG